MVSVSLLTQIALRVAVAADEQVDDAIHEALAFLAGESRSDRVYVTLFHDDDTFGNSHEWIRTNVVPQKPAIQRFPVSQFPYSDDFARRDQVLEVLDVRDLPNAARAERESFSAFGVRGLLQVPIRVEDATVGLVGYNDFEPRTGWDESLLQYSRVIGQAIGVALVRRRAKLEVSAARSAMEQANWAKDELLAHVSHELRTPLHAILGYTELLELEDRPDHEHDALREIQVSGRRLLHMVEDLIELADHSDQHDGEPAEVALAIDAAIENLSAVAELRNVRFRTAAAIDGATIETEPGRLRQIVYCALSGALQSLAGGGRITIDPYIVSSAGATADQDHACDGLSITIDGDRSVTTTRLVMPMARALLSGHGWIDVIPAERDRSTRIVIAFDQFAKP